jgi:cilla- and flagella-associated protein
MKQLTEQLVLTRCKCEKLVQVKNLNMWGSELEDVTIVKDLPNLEICSLSLNKIKSLAAFQQCRKLTELYLRKNSIENLSDIRYLSNLPLKVIWLVDNPICNHANYRLYIIKVLPNLVKLDNTAVGDDERKVCAQLSEAELLKSSSSS